VILRVGDREVRDPNHAQRILMSYEADEPVRITVRRNGRETTVEGSRD
jgi:type II secretory pathway component PulC